MAGSETRNDVNKNIEEILKRLKETNHALSKLNEGHSTPASAPQEPVQGRSGYKLGFQPINIEEANLLGSDPASKASSERSSLESDSTKSDSSEDRLSSYLEEESSNTLGAGGAQSSQVPEGFSSSSNVPGSEPQTQRTGNWEGSVLARLFRAAAVAFLGVSAVRGGAPVDPSSMRRLTLSFGDNNRLFNIEPSTDLQGSQTYDLSGNYQDKQAVMKRVDKETKDLCALVKEVSKEPYLSDAVQIQGELAKLYLMLGNKVPSVLSTQFSVPEGEIVQFFNKTVKECGEAIQPNGDVDVDTLVSVFNQLQKESGQTLFTSETLEQCRDLVKQSAQVARKQINIFNRIGRVMKAYQLVQSQPGQASQSKAMIDFLDNPIIANNKSSLQSLIGGATRAAESVQRGGTLEYQGGPDISTTIWGELTEGAQQQLVESVGNEQNWETLISAFESLQNMRSKQVDSQRAPVFRVSQLTKENVERHNKLNTSRSSSDVSRDSLSQATTVPDSHSTTHTQSAKSHSSSNVSGLTEESDLFSLYSASIGEERPHDKEELMAPGVISFTYHYTDKDGNPGEHRNPRKSFCHNLSGGDDSRSNGASITDEETISRSSESSQQSPKYHTVSVAWDANSTAHDAGAQCMREYLTVMGLQRDGQANLENTLAVIEFLEHEWGSHDHVSSSDDDMSHRLEALFEKIPINAHPEQQDVFKEGAKEAFMHILQPSLEVDYSRGKDLNVGHVGARPKKSSRLNSSRSSLQKIQKSSESSSNSKPPIDLSSSHSHNAGPQYKI